MADIDLLMCLDCKHQHVMSERSDSKPNQCGVVDQLCPKCGGKEFTKQNLERKNND